MSHESLAALWTVLNQYQDVTVCIRDATGHYAFNSIHNDDSDANLRALITYAIELVAVLDFVRTTEISKDQSAHTEKHTIYQDQLCRALAYLIHNLRTEHITGEPPLSRLHVAILTRAVLSATCALYSISTVQQSREAEHVASAAYKIASQIPESREDLDLLRLLCSYLISHFGGGMMGQQNDGVIATRGDIWHMNPEDRSEIVEELVERATKSSTISTNRITAIIELCQAYWESEAFLTRGCIPENPLPQNSTSKEGSERLAVALEIRVQIQEHLVNANLDETTERWAQNFGPHMLFMPGLGLSCVLDVCTCAFNSHERVVIHYAVSTTNEQIDRD